MFNKDIEIRFYAEDITRIHAQQSLATRLAAFLRNHSRKAMNNQ